MEATELKICRLCLNVICKNYYEIEGEKLLMVKTVFKDLNWTLCQSRIMCCECSEELQNSYDFKTTCLITEERITAASTGKRDEVDLWQIRGENDHRSQEEKRICRFCLKLNENRMCFYLDEKEDILLMLQKCLLGLDLFMVREPVICQSCLVALECLFNFVVGCLSIEKSINMYRDAKGSNSMDKVNLYNVLQFIKFKEENHGRHKSIEDFVSGNEFVKSKNVEDEEFAVKPGISLKDEPLELKEESEDSVRHGDIEVDTGTRASERSCHQCNFTTKYRKGLKSHIMVIHVKPKHRPFHCNECSYRTIYKERLKAHVHWHTQDLPYICKVCPKRYHHQRSLDNHIVVKHPDSKQVIKSKVRRCNACDFKTVFTIAMARHMSVHGHKDTKIFKCDKCTFATARKSDLKNHVFIHARAKPFVCFECSKDFSRKIQLHSHILTRHSDKKEGLKLISYKIHYCTLCDYKAVELSSLHKHVKRRHPGDKPFVCSQCWMGFTTKTQLYTHVLTQHR